MLLITMNEWVGPGRHFPADEKPPKVTERKMSFASRKTLRRALEHIQAYQEAYNAHYKLAVNFTLLSVHVIDDVGNELLDFFRAELAEDLKQSTEDFA